MPNKFYHGEGKKNDLTEKRERKGTRKCKKKNLSYV